MVTFRLGSTAEVDVERLGLTVRGPAREDVLQVVETQPLLTRQPGPGMFRVFLKLNYEEKLALAAALNQAAKNQKNS